MKLSNIVTVIILAISSTLTPQAMAEKLIPETDAELLVWSDATSVEYMKYAAKEFNKDFGYKVKFTFRNIAPMDAASRIMQDGGTTRVADVAEIEHENSMQAFLKQWNDTRTSSRTHGRTYEICQCLYALNPSLTISYPHTKQLVLGLTAFFIPRKERLIYAYDLE